MKFYLLFIFLLSLSFSTVYSFEDATRENLLVLLSLSLFITLILQ